MDSPPRTRRPRRRVDGVLLLDKPSGLSSNAALQRAKRAFDAEKAGHTGTLDPLASGLLPLCFGEATKFARFLLEADKRYIASVRFGVTTTTQDAEGAEVESRPVDFGRAAVEAALPAFMGELWQVPPAHSALKFEGRNYYEYAREGIDIPRQPRSVRIDRLTLVDWESPVATLDVVCSKGTYIRALAFDLGEALSCGAYLAGLRRVATGGFDLAAATTLEALEHCASEARDALLLPVDCLLAAMPRLEVDGEAAARLRQGQPIAAPRLPGLVFRVYDPEGRLLGIVRREAEALVPERLARTSDTPPVAA